MAMRLMVTVARGGLGRRLRSLVARGLAQRKGERPVGAQGRLPATSRLAEADEVKAIFADPFETGESATGSARATVARSRKS
ncbi:hypothetical protein ATO4_25123 [Aurantimonas sp. 22II-16-19i]|nr:hypothetical protein ATO4_25123 [Aurantimonas sp. 22II-16-19i]